MSEQHVPAVPAFEPEAPGVIFREEFLEPAGVNVSAAAERLGVSRQTLHRVLAGSAGITAEMALRIGRLTGTTPTFWLNLQAQRDLWREAKKIAAQLRRIKVIGGQ